MKQLITIKVDGTTEVTFPRVIPTLKEMQAMVDGYIEPVRGIKCIGHTGVMVANEEGLLLNLPINRKASAIAEHSIVGDVFILIGWLL